MLSGGFVNRGFCIAMVFSLLLFLTASGEAGARDYREGRGGYHHGGGYYWWGPAIGSGIGLLMGSAIGLDSGQSSRARGSASL